MARHLTDHRVPSRGGRLVRFLAIDRAQDKGPWLSLAKRPMTTRGTRRLIEFLRIARGRSI